MGSCLTGKAFIYTILAAPAYAMKTESVLKKIGITGAAGNIGTTLRKGLSDRYELTLFDQREIRNLGGCRFRKIDFAEEKQLEGAFEGLDALIHLAGDPRPNAPAQLTLRNNFLATSLVFEEARKAGLKKIVFASSNFYHQGSIAEALQGRLKGCIRLDTPPTPRCLYADSKVFGENVGRHLSHLGVKFAALRIGWTVPEDNPLPYDSQYMRAVFLSHRDLVQGTDLALNARQDFLAAFAVSDNTTNVFDLSETKKLLGYAPQDNSEDYS